MAEKFYVEPGVVKESREYLQLKRTAFGVVSDRIARDREHGKQVSIKSAHKVAKRLGVSIERLKAKDGRTASVFGSFSQRDTIQHSPERKTPRRERGPFRAHGGSASRLRH